VGRAREKRQELRGRASKDVNTEDVALERERIPAPPDRARIQALLAPAQRTEAQGLDGGQLRRPGLSARWRRAVAEVGVE